MVMSGPDGEPGVGDGAAARAGGRDVTTELPGFHGLQELHRSHKSLVLRGVRTHDGMKVVL